MKDIGLVLDEGLAEIERDIIGANNKAYRRIKITRNKKLRNALKKVKESLRKARNQIFDADDTIKRRETMD